MERLQFSGISTLALQAEMHERDLLEEARRRTVAPSRPRRRPFGLPWLRRLRGA